MSLSEKILKLEKKIILRKKKWLKNYLLVDKLSQNMKEA